LFILFSSRRRHTRFSRDWSSDVCSSDLEEILDEEGYLYCLGDIVHNDEEVARLKAKGLRIISHDDLQTLQNEKVLIRAHGEAPETYRIALENNITLIDASCPVVLKLQNRIKTSHEDEEKLL